MLNADTNIRYIYVLASGAARDWVAFAVPDKYFVVMYTNIHKCYDFGYKELSKDSASFQGARPQLVSVSFRFYLKIGFVLLCLVVK